MALIKKLAAGNTIDRNTLNAELDKQISAFRMKSKDERRVRDALSKFRDSFDGSDPSKAFAVDDLTKTYTVTGVDSGQFQGSADEIKSHWFTGKLKLADDQDVNSVAAAIYNQALKTLSQPAQTTKSTEAASQSSPIDLSIKNLKDYILSNDAYVTDDNFGREWVKYRTDDDRKKKLYNLISGNVGKYLAGYEQNKDKYNFTDIDTARTLQSLVSSENPDWEQVKNASAKLGWVLNDYLIQADEAEAYSKEDAGKAAAEFKQSLTQYGMSGATQDALIAGQYTTLDNDWVPEGITDPNWFKKLLVDNNAKIFSNPSGQRIIMSGNIPLQFNVQDRFSPGYGYSGYHNENGFQLISPEKWETNPNAKWDSDPYATSNIGKELVTDLPNATVWGWSNEKDGLFNKDVLGRRDFTKNIVIEQNGHKTNAHLDPTTGKYITDSGQEVNLNIQGYGKRIIQINDYNLPMPSIPQTRLSPKWLSTNKWADDFGLLSTAIRDSQTSEKRTEAAARLKAALSQSPEIRKNPKLKERIYNALIQYHGLLNGTVVYREGGVLLAQQGMSLAEYKKELAKRKSLEEVLPSGKKIHDISGSWKDQDGAGKALSATSVAGMGLSFIPGIGAVGAGVSFGADLANDLRDGKMDDLGNHLLNLGFVGLSAIGLGGVKAFLKAGQVGSKVGNVAKAASKAKGLKLGKAEVKSLEDIVELSNKYNASNAKDLTSKVLLAGNEAETKLLKEGLEVVGSINAASSPILGSALLGAGVKKVGTGVSSLLSKVGNSKSLRNTARVALITPGLISGVGFVKDWTTKGGFEYTTPYQLKNMLGSAYTAKLWGKDALGIRALKRQTKPVSTTADQATITIGEKSFTVDGKMLPPKLKSEWGYGKSKKAEYNKEAREEFKGNVLKALGKEADTLTPAELALLDDPAKIKIQNIQGSESAQRVLHTEIQNVSPDRAINAYEHQLAGEYLNKYQPKIAQEAPKVGNSPGTSETVLGSNKKRVKAGNLSKHKKRIKTSEDLAPVTSAPPAIIEGPKHNLPPIEELLKRQLKANKLSYRKPKPKALPPHEELPTVAKRNATSKTSGKSKSTQKSNKTPKTPKKQLGGVVLKLQEGWKLGANKDGLGQLLGKWGKAGIKAVGENVDATDLANIGMAANTMAANRIAGKRQREAANASRFTLPTLQKTWVRKTALYTPMANQQAATLSGKYSRIAGTQSDIDRSLAIKSEGALKSYDIMNNGYNQDRARLDQMENQQRVSDSAVDAKNSEIIGRNRSINAEVNRQISLVSANEAIAQNTAINNLVLGLEKNIVPKKMEKTLKESDSIYNNEDYQSLMREYTDLNSQENLEKIDKEYKDQLDDMSALGGSSNLTLQQSNGYLNMLSRKKALEEAMKPYSKQLQNLGNRYQQLQYRYLYRKSGGTLTLTDRIELEKFKGGQKAAEKDLERTFKAILHNNEMLEKSLIKIFK